MTRPGNIARNTLFLYIRMFITLCVTLFTSRIVIGALGETDYGIYNVVAGVSTSFVFFSSALSTSTQRFFNFEMERGTPQRVRGIFSMSLVIYGTLALLVLAAGLSLGEWLVSDKLVMPPDRRSDAYIVLIAMLLSLSFMLVASVYESVLVARENMKLYAYLGIADAFGKLAIAIAVIYMPHKLVTYAILMVVVQLLPYVIMVLYCRRHYPETRLQWFWEKGLFKEMFGFTGWNVYGSVIWMVNEQGISILLNLFFGPVVNAARGVATSVNNAVNNFSTQFFTAVRPQIVKRYAAGEDDSLISLVYSSTKFTIFLLWLLCLPIMLRTDYIMHLWLKSVPEWTVPFVIWTLVYTMVNSLNNPTYTAVSATGHLRYSVLVGSNLFLLAFPLSYAALKLGAPPMAVYPMLIAGRFAFFIVTISRLRRYSSVTYRDYLLKIGWPVFRVLAVSGVTMYLLNSIVPQNLAGLAGVVLCSLPVSAACAYVLGLSAAEKSFARSKINQLIDKFRR